MAEDNMDSSYGLCPSWALSVGYLGVASAAVLSNWGSAWGTWKAGVSLVNTGIRHPGSVMKNVIPIVMAGGKVEEKWFFSIAPEIQSYVQLKIAIALVIGIYGLIIAVILAESIPKPMDTRENVYSIYTGMAHLCAGLCCGLSGLAAGGCIGIVGDFGVRSVGYRASNISLFPSTSEKSGYATIPDDSGDSGDVSGSDDQNKLFVGMLIMLIFSEALAL